MKQKAPNPPPRPLGRNELLIKDKNKINPGIIFSILLIIFVIVNVIVWLFNCFTPNL